MSAFASENRHWSRRSVVGAGLASLLWQPLSSAQAARSGYYALVIGIGAYPYGSSLRNPPNDARAVSESLTRLGFTILGGIDLNAAQVRAAIEELIKLKSSARFIVFYYAGHGTQINGENFLLPSDIDASSETEGLREQLISINQIVATLDAGADGVPVLVMLDACRDNPFSASFSELLGRSRGARSAWAPVRQFGVPVADRYVVGTGLARMERGNRLIVSYATTPGNVALDGDGQNSPYTESLLRYLEVPGLEVGEILNLTQQAVAERTKSSPTGPQYPQTVRSLPDFVYLKRLRAPPR